MPLRFPDRLAPGKLDVAGIAVDEIGRRNHALLERGRRGDDLERRSRLVDVLDRTIAAQLLTRVAIRVRIEIGRVGQRQNLAGVGIHDDRRPARRTSPLDAVAQLTLGDVLQKLVDGQLERRARGRWPLDAAERAAARVALDQHRAGPAEDQPVVRRLDAGQANVVDANVAEHVRGQIGIRVGALALLDESNARQLERRNALRLIRPYLPTDVGEVLALANALDHRLTILRVTVGQGAADRGDSGLRVAELARYCIDRVGVHTVGKDVAVAIENVAALGGRFDGA